MKHFILFYDYVDDYMERRAALRPAHFEHAKAALAREEMVLAGAMTDEGPPMGVLVFKTKTRETVENFARNDPYVKGGLTKAWRVREWSTVAGRDAINKLI